MLKRLYFHEVTLQYSCKKVQATSGNKKVKQILQTKKDFIACSKLIIKGFKRCPTRSDNIYFANNKQASLTVFTAVFCFVHAEHN